MDDIARASGITQDDRAERARDAWELYAATYSGSEIQDLITDLLHLADADTEDGGAVALASAERHYGSEVPEGE